MKRHAFPITFTPGIRFLLVAATGVLCVIFSADDFKSGQAPNRKRIFEDIYKYKVWGVNRKGTGHSGSGSTVEFTKAYRSFLQDFLAKMKGDISYAGQVFEETLFVATKAISYSILSLSLRR